ncbi:MAG: glycosyl hydrolase [Bacteroidales bacterium]|nr:MAG: glycosyl hydrolase [Bacteroidales bacterium]
MRNYNLHKLIVCILLLLSGCATDKEAYLFSYFTNNGHDGLHLAYSYDGHKWQILNNGQSFIQPVIGKDSLMRDPSICQGSDGIFHLVWTSGWWDQGIGYASSTDLIHWSEQQNIPVMEHLKETRNTWAPEVFFDDASHLFYIVWASTVVGKFPEIETTSNEKGLNHRLYCTTTPDFKTFSPTSLFYNPGFSVIDGAILKTDSTYLMVIKNEMSVPKEKNLRISFTTDLSKGFPTQVSNNISGNSWVEGPSPLKIGKYIYIYFDKYRNKKYGAIRSLDGKNWEDISESIDLPKGIRHGTAFKVSENTLNNLLGNTLSQ